MDRCSIISITAELPQDQVVAAKLPLDIEALPSENQRPSYDYINSLELEKYKTFNHSLSEIDVSFKIGHIYKSPTYINKYIDIFTPTTIGVKWTDMTPGQIAGMINSKWVDWFGKEILVFSQQEKRYTIELPPGMSLYLCHGVIWGHLGFEFETVFKYDMPNYEKSKFPARLRKDIAGFINNDGSDMLILNGERCDESTLRENYEDIADILDRDEVTRSSRFFAIITFAQTKSFYNTFFERRMTLDLVVVSKKFLKGLRAALAEYADLICELQELAPEDRITNILKSELVVKGEENFLMVIKTQKAIENTDILIFIDFDKKLSDYLGKSSIRLHDRMNVLNVFNHKDFVLRNLYRYPFYLCISNSDVQTADVQSSINNQSHHSIVAVLYPDNSFTNTLPIRLKPNNFNTLLFKILDRNLQPITERVTMDFVFRFQREPSEKPIECLDRRSFHFNPN